MWKTTHELGRLVVTGSAWSYYYLIYSLHSPRTLSNSCELLPHNLLQIRVKDPKLMILKYYV